MQIIPVIDICGGEVVLASGGNRKNYPPLHSVLTQHKQPINVIADLLDFHGFNIVYLADLDGILYQTPNIKLHSQLARKFPDIVFWVDMGIQTKKQWTSVNAMTGIQPIIASESLQEISLLTSMKQRGILSLDFQHGELLGQLELWQQSELWTDVVIAMNIDNVGAQAGPDVTLLKKIQQKRNDVQLIAAGGVRTAQDLHKLAQENISAVLVASALHNGNLSTKVLRDFQQ